MPKNRHASGKTKKPSGPPATPSRLVPQLDRILKWLDDGRIDEAEARIDELLKVYPRNRDLLELRMEIATRTDDRILALNTVERLVGQHGFFDSFSRVVENPRNQGGRIDRDGQVSFEVERRGTG
jgi:predicted Zn-dependent protease